MNLKEKSTVLSDLSTCSISINIRCKSGHNAGPHQKKLEDIYFAKISLIKETADALNCEGFIFGYDLSQPWFHSAPYVGPTNLFAFRCSIFVLIPKGEDLELYSPVIC